MNGRQDVDAGLIGLVVTLVAAALWWSVRRGPGLVLGALAYLLVPRPWGLVAAVVVVVGWWYLRWGRRWSAHRRLRRQVGRDAAGATRVVHRSWAPTMRGCGLAQRPESYRNDWFGLRVRREDAGDEQTWPVPSLLGVEPHALGIVAHVGPLVGQSIETFQAAALALAHAWRVLEVRVESEGPHRSVDLVLVLYDPLRESRPVATPDEARGWN